MRLLPDTDCSKTQWRYYQKHQIRTVVFNLIGATLLGLISSVAYAVPMMTNYQGTLQDTNGSPLNTSVRMTFSLYDAPEGGTHLWTETHPDVTVTNGVFSVVLGSVVNFTAADMVNCWLVLIRHPAAYTPWIRSPVNSLWLGKR